MGELYLYLRRLGEPQSRSGSRRREKSVNPTGIRKPDRPYRTLKEPEGLSQCSDHIVEGGGAEGLCCVPGKGNRCLYIPELILALILDFHREINVVSFLDLRFLHGVNLQKTFRKPLWVPSSLIHDQLRWDPQRFPKRCR